SQGRHEWQDPSQERQRHGQVHPLAPCPGTHTEKIRGHYAGGREHQEPRERRSHAVLLNDFSLWLSRVNQMKRGMTFETVRKAWRLIPVRSRAALTDRSRGAEGPALMTRVLDPPFAPNRVRPRETRPKQV